MLSISTPEKATKQISCLFLCRWLRSVREEGSVQTPQPQPRQKQPPRGPNVPTAGRPTPVQASNASNITGARCMPPMQKRAVWVKGAIWRRSTLLRSKTSSCKRSTRQLRSGLGRWTLTIMALGNGPTDPHLTSPTGCPINPMGGSTSRSWTATIQLLASGGTWSSTAAITISVNLPCRYCICRNCFCYFPLTHNMFHKVNSRKF